MEYFGTSRDVYIDGHNSKRIDERYLSTDLTYRIIDRQTAKYNVQTCNINET